MNVFTSLIGDKGIVLVVGLMIFAFALRYGHQMFEWIENQTFGTRNYILEKLELLFIEIKPEHVTYILLGCSFGLGGLALLLLGFFGLWIPGIILGVIVTVIGFRFPKPFINYLHQRRIKQYEGQMVDALQLLSNGVRAGLSLPQSLGIVVDELPPPIAQEFNAVLQQNKIGVPLEECFENLASRVPTEDNDMFAASVNILRETGGNLAETFDTIVSVIRERMRLKQKIETYTAQGMFQGATIAAMPFAITGIYAATDPGAVKVLFTTLPGILMVIAAVILDLVGAVIMFKIVKIKV